MSINIEIKILNMVIPILMHYKHFPFKKTVKMYFVVPIRQATASCIKPLASCIYSLVNQWKATLRNDVGFPTVYRRIYCRKFMTLSNQTSRCICKCIRIVVYRFYCMALFHSQTRPHMINTFSSTMAYYFWQIHKILLTNHFGINLCAVTVNWKQI